MHLSLHEITQRTIDYLVLLHHRFTFEIRADHSGLEVVSVTLNRDLGAGNPGLYQFLQLVCLHLVYHL